MTNRNACTGKWILVFVAVVVLNGCQPKSEEIGKLEKTAGSTELGDAKDREVEQLRQAADQGDAGAQYKLGVRCAEGDGVPLDHREEVRWYGLAADQGHASAQHAVGSSYAKGEGMPQDYREAVKWYRKAAEQGHAWGQHSLGNSYAKGEGVPQDYVKAHAWLNLATAHKFRQGRLGGSIMSFGEMRDRLAAQMTTAQIAEAQKLAADPWQRIESSESE